MTFQPSACTLGRQVLKLALVLFQLDMLTSILNTSHIETNERLVGELWKKGEHGDKGEMEQRHAYR